MKPTKKFRCGRLMLTKNGTVKKVDLKNGGGSRFCVWYYYGMTFHDLHQRLIKLFNLENTRYDTCLYDYRMNPLSMSEYSNFAHYVKKNGLNLLSTVIYICTNEVEHTESENPIPIPTPTSTINEDKSLPPIIECKPVIKMEKIDIEQENSFTFNYSFKNAINDLVKHLRYFINSNNVDQNLIQLFENICIINGYTCSTIEFINNHVQHSSLLNSSNYEFYRNNLIDISDIIQVTKSLLVQQNKNQFKDNQEFLIIEKLFDEYSKNFKILFDQWSERIQKSTASSMN